MKRMKTNKQIEELAQKKVQEMIDSGQIATNSKYFLVVTGENSNDEIYSVKLALKDNEVTKGENSYFIDIERDIASINNDLVMYASIINDVVNLAGDLVSFSLTADTADNTVSILEIAQTDTWDSYTVALYENGSQIGYWEL